MAGTLPVGEKNYGSRSLHCAAVTGGSFTAALWQVHSIDFDTACGFDIQFLTGDGLNQTIEYLGDVGRRCLLDSRAESSARIAAFGNLAISLFRLAGERDIAAAACAGFRTAL